MRKLPGEFEILTSEGNLESTVFFGTFYGMQAKYKLTKKNRQKY